MKYDDAAILDILARDRAGERLTRYERRLVAEVRAHSIKHDPSDAEWWQANHPVRKRGRPAS